MLANRAFNTIQGDIVYINLWSLNLKLRYWKSGYRSSKRRVGVDRWGISCSLSMQYRLWEHK